MNIARLYIYSKNVQFLPLPPPHQRTVSWRNGFISFKILIDMYYILYQMQQGGYPEKNHLRSLFGQIKTFSGLPFPYLTAGLRAKSPEELKFAYSVTESHHYWFFSKGFGNKKRFNTWIPSGKFMEESIKTASWLKFISNLQRLGAICT